MRGLLRSAAAAFVLFWVCCASSVAAQSGTLLGGELGRWLQGEALPELSALLGQHPRFKGERLRIVPMREGTPRASSDLLTDAIMQQLTHRLTRVKGVQLAWSDAPQRCGIPRDTPYLLGVDVRPEGRDRYLVQIAMVDVVEGVWVSGAHKQWRGRLSSTERAARREVTNRAAVGTVDKPVPESDTKAVLELLVKSIQCGLASGLDGALFVQAEDASDAVAVRLARLLRGQLIEKAIVAVAEDQTTADWLLVLNREQHGVQALVATLEARVDAQTAQRSSASTRLAEVYVRGDGVSPQPVTGPPARVVRAEISPEVMGPLIVGLHEVVPTPGERCYSGGRPCAELEFELVAPAYLFVLRSRGAGHVNPGISLGHCEGVKKTSGIKRYRIAAEERVGFYALATTDATFAKTLQRRLASVARNCTDRSGNHPLTPDRLEALDELLARNQSRLHWRAHYVSADPDSREPAIAFRTHANEEVLR